MTEEPNTPQVASYTGKVEIVDAFKKGLIDQKLLHSEEMTAALGKVLEKAPAEIKITQTVIDEALAHYKANPNIDGVKAAFASIIEKATDITTEVKTTLKTAINDDAVVGLKEKLPAIAEDVKKGAGFFTKESWAVKHPAFLDDIKNAGENKVRLGFRTLGLATAIGVGLSGIKDEIGRPANDNSGTVEYFPIKGAVKLGAAAASVFAAACYKGKGSAVAARV